MLTWGFKICKNIHGGTVLWRPQAREIVP